MSKAVFVIAMILLLLYKLCIIALTCYMTVNHGGYWIFLILFSGIKVESKE